MSPYRESWRDRGRRLGRRSDRGDPDLWDASIRAGVGTDLSTALVRQRTDGARRRTHRGRLRVDSRAIWRAGAAAAAPVEPKPGTWHAP